MSSKIGNSFHYLSPNESKLFHKHKSDITYRSQISQIEIIQCSCQRAWRQSLHEESHPEDVHSNSIQRLDGAGVWENIVGPLF